MIIECKLRNITIRFRCVEVECASEMRPTLPTNGGCPISRRPRRWKASEENCLTLGFACGRVFVYSASSENEMWCYPPKAMFRKPRIRKLNDLRNVFLYFWKEHGEKWLSSQLK